MEEEGTGREGEKEAKCFFNIAKGSVSEVVSLLCIMERQGYVTEREHEALYTECDEIARMLTGLLSR